MPTKKPRLNISLTPASRAALERFAAVSGIAAAQFVAKIVEDSIPVIESMTEAFEVARRSPQQASNVMRDSVTDAMVRAAQTHLQLDSSVRQRPLRKRPSRD